MSIILIVLIYSSSNYSYFDDLNGYIEEYSKEETTMFDNINFALKIMPGYNTEKNALYMEQTNNVTQ